MRNGRHPIVLVIDDDPAVLRSLRFALEIDGFDVRIYPSGADLLAAGDLPRSGCLVIDYHMPGMDGIELLGQLRQQGVALPAILITSHPDALLHRRAGTAGILRIVEKPLLSNALVDSIREALGRDAPASPDAPPAR